MKKDEFNEVKIINEGKTHLSSLEIPLNPNLFPIAKIETKFAMK